MGPEDLFLFFGLFQEITTEDGVLRYQQGSVRKHVIWGWLQIDSCVNVDTCDRNRMPWALYHPHFHCPHDKSNTLYLSREKLQLPGVERHHLKGAGVFPSFSPLLLLTSGDATLGGWKLPKWMYPTPEKPALSYHGNLSRWKHDDEFAYLKTVGRGQEFVLNSDFYPEVFRLC